MTHSPARVVSYLKDLVMGSLGQGGGVAAEGQANEVVVELGWESQVTHSLGFQSSEKFHQTEVPRAYSAVEAKLHGGLPLAGRDAADASAVGLASTEIHPVDRAVALQFLVEALPVVNRGGAVCPVVATSPPALVAP
ncbi:MAG: hypothetical protein EBU88_07215 [Acidobacteria bacterium]|nr:hypothetical protein [Acidobacteriota bacterium]